MGGRADASMSHSSCCNAAVAGAAARVATGAATAMAGAVGDVGWLAVASAGAAGVAHSSGAADKTSVITRVRFRRVRFRRLRLRCRGWAEFALPGRLLLIWGSVRYRGWTGG